MFCGQGGGGGGWHEKVSLNDMSNDVFGVFLLRGKEKDSGRLTFDPGTGLYLRRAEVAQEQRGRDEEGRGWERAVVEERVGEEQEGGRGKRVEEQERGSGSQGREGGTEGRGGGPKSGL